MKLDEISSPTLHVPIGPSGSGKTTLFNKLKAQNPHLTTFSLDKLRHEWYDRDNYANAWKMSTQDPKFKSNAYNRFHEMVDTQEDIYVDHTNLSPKVRRFFLQTAKAKGYKTIAYVFNVDVDTLLARQLTRGDKNVPEDAVRQQVKAFKPPQAGEFDEVVYL